MRDFTELADDVTLLVESVSWKRKKLAELGDKIVECRADADAKLDQAKVYEDLAKKNREESEALRKAAGAAIDEELTVKKELEADEKNLEALEAAFAAVGLKVTAVDQAAPDSDRTVAALVDTETGETLDIKETDSVGAADGSFRMLDGTVVFPMDDDEIDDEAITDKGSDHDSADRFAGIAARRKEVLDDEIGIDNAKPVELDPSADQVQEHVDTFVETIRSKHETDRDVKHTDPDVISAVSDYTAEEAIAAGREDEIRDEVASAKNAG